MKRIVVFSEQRTGSNFLLSRLGQHPDFVNCAELLNPANPSRAPTVLTREQFATLRKDDPVKLIKEYVFDERGWSKGNVNVMFKFQYQNIFSRQGHNVFNEIAKSFPDIYAIHLIRENAFDRLVSKLNAEKTGQYFARVGMEAKRAPNPYRIERPFAERLMRQYLRRVDDVRSRLKVFHALSEVKYEELVSDQEATFAKVFRFLSEEPIKTVSVSQKQSLEARFQIKNYEYLMKCFAGTEFEKYFDKGPGY